MAGFCPSHRAAVGLGGDTVYVGGGGRGMVVMKTESRRRARLVSTRHPMDQTNAGNSSLTTYPRRVPKDLYERMLT